MQLLHLQTDKRSRKLQRTNCRSCTFCRVQHQRFNVSAPDPRNTFLSLFSLCLTRVKSCDRFRVMCWLIKRSKTNVNAIEREELQRKEPAGTWVCKLPFPTFQHWSLASDDDMIVCDLSLHWHPHLHTNALSDIYLATKLFSYQPAIESPDSRKWQQLSWKALIQWLKKCLDGSILD